MQSAPRAIKHSDTLSTVSPVGCQLFSYNQQLTRTAAVSLSPPTFTYAGRTLPHTDSYKYLGTTFTPAGMAGDGLAQVRSNVGRAFNNVRFKFDRLGHQQHPSPAASLRRHRHLHSPVIL